MALTAEDLKNIERIVGKSEGRLGARLDGRMDGLESRMDGLESRMDGLEGRLEARMDRMESRILFGMSLLERDGFDTIEDHERRIRKLEELQARGK